MTKPMREALSTIEERLPSVDLDAVRDHLPSIKDLDTAAVAERVRSKAKGGKRPLIVMAIGMLGGAIAYFALQRRR